MGRACVLRRERCRKRGRKSAACAPTRSATVERRSPRVGRVPLPSSRSPRRIRGRARSGSGALAELAARADARPHHSARATFVITVARAFLLSPARLDGERARMLFHPATPFATASALRSRDGAEIGTVMSFLSGLYFRGKLAY